MRIKGLSPREGIVSIERDGKWSTICAKDWDIQDANVLCHYLGYPSALKALSSSTHVGSYYSNANCSGEEDSLDACFLKKKSGQCRQARVICERGMYKRIQN